MSFKGGCDIVQEINIGGLHLEHRVDIANIRLGHLLDNFRVNVVLSTIFQFHGRIDVYCNEVGHSITIPEN